MSDIGLFYEGGAGGPFPRRYHVKDGGEVFLRYLNVTCLVGYRWVLLEKRQLQDIISSWEAKTNKNQQQIIH